MIPRHLLCDWNPEGTVCCVVHAISDVRVGHIFAQGNGTFACVGHNTEIPPVPNVRSFEEALLVLDEMRRREEYPRSYIDEAVEQMENQWENEQQETWDTMMSGGNPFHELR